MKNAKNNLTQNLGLKKISFPNTAPFLYKIFLATKPNEKGTALGVAFGFGFLMILLGTLAIIRSGTDKTNAAVSESTQQNLGITNAGISQVIADLNQSSTKGLLLKTFDPTGKLGSILNEWTSTSAPALTYTGINSCGGSNTNTVANSLNSVSSNVAVNVNVGTGSSAGTYQLLAYRFVDGNGNTNPEDVPNTGRLLLEGKINTQQDSKSRILVEFPVTVTPTLTGITSSALIATDLAIGQSDAFASSVTCTNPASCPLTCAGSQPTANELETGLGATNVGNAVMTNPYTGTQSTIQIGSANIPNIPAVPAGATVNNLGTVSSDKTLPQTGDVATGTSPNQTYYYQIADWNSSAILINTTAQIRIYISGNITQNGNDDLRMVNAANVPTPGQIRVYGGLSNGNPPPTIPQNWQMSGNACTMAFIHAPNANVGIDGGGNGCSGINLADAQANAAASVTPVSTTGLIDPNNTNIYGGIWAQTYNLIGNSSNSSVFYQQPGLMELIDSEGAGFPGFKGVKMESTNSWQRQEVN